MGKLQDKWTRRWMFTPESQIELAGQYITQLKKEKEKLRIECNRLYGIGQEYDKEVKALRRENGTLKAAFAIGIHLLGHADFKNGNTGPNGIIDEGEVYACRLMDKIEALVPQMYADILEGKDD